MSPDENTIYDGGETTIRGTDITAQAAGETRLDSGETVLSAETVMHTEHVNIEKGSTLLETYRVESDAIQGGMGKVWRVHHTGWNVELAMKQPKSELFQNEQQKADFIHECEAWINLGLHPQIVSCYYVREVGGIPSIFAEWMQGGSLKNWIYSGKLYEGDSQAALERVLDIAIQFGRGLHYAHEQGLIHQDVKPDNLLLTPEGEAKVADFGIANARAVLTMRDADAPPDATMVSGSGAYTLAYCSMEQINGKKLTRRTDIYSWAVSVLEMFLGDRFWENGKIAGEAFEDYLLMEMRVPMPEGVKSLLRVCLNENPEKRPHDFAEIDATLSRIYRDAIGNTYPREFSKAAADTADSLNNRALSFLDLGMREEAERCFERALEFVPGHLHATYNQSMHLWRRGGIDDREAARRIATVDGHLAARVDGEGLVLTKVYDFLSAYDKARNNHKRYYSSMQPFEDNSKLFCLIGHEAGSIACEDVASQKALWNVTCHKSRAHMNYSGKSGVNGFAISSHKRHFYSHGPDGLINKIDIKTGAVMAAIDINEIHYPDECTCSGVRTLCISPDGEWIACISDHPADEGLLYILDAQTLRPHKTYTDKHGQLRAVGFLPDGRLITAAQNRQLSVWGVECGLIETILLEKDIQGLCVRADGNMLVCDAHNSMYLMGMSGRISKKFATAHGEYHEMKISENGIAVASFEHTMVFDTYADGCAKIISGGKPGITAQGRHVVTNDCAAYSFKDGHRADYMLCAIKSYDETQELDNRFCAAIQAGYGALERLDLPQALAAFSAAKDLKGDHVECFRLNDAIGVHGSRTGIQAINQIGTTLAHPFAITDICFSHSKDTVLCLVGKNEIYLYTKEGEYKTCYKDIDMELSHVSFSINDQTLICCGLQSALFIDLTTNEIERLTKGYHYITFDLRYGVVSGEAAGTFIIYDLGKNAAVHMLSGGGKHILRTVEQDNRLYLFFTDKIGAADTFISSIEVINMSTLQTENRYCFLQNTDYRANTAFSVHNLYCVGRRSQQLGGKIYKNQPAVLNGGDFAVCNGKLYPTDKSLVAKFDKSNAAITDVVLSDDDRFLFTVDSYGIMKIYDIAGGGCVKQIDAHTGEIKRVVLEGSFIATGGQDGVLKLWNATWEYSYSAL